MQAIGLQKSDQTQHPYGQYGNGMGDNMDSTSLNISRRAGLSPAEIDDSHKVGQNLATMATEGITGANESGNSGKQKSWGQMIGAAANPQNGSHYVAGQGANYGEIAKTGAAMLATGLQWVRKAQASNLEDQQKALDQYVQHQYQQDRAAQGKVTSASQQQQNNNTVANSSAQSSWEDELDQMNHNNATIHAMLEASNQKNTGA